MKNELPNNIEVGERIRNIRKELNMSRESFSEAIDISDVFLGQIERGERSLSLKTLCRIVKFTGTTTDYILFGTPEENHTVNKINRILNKSSDEFIDYIYQILNTSFSYFKSIKKK
jgi:transcriptional regulator with XRE-family HTH domain